MPNEHSKQNAERVWSIMLASDASPYIGEPISQLEHALQAADRALAVGCDEAVVLAALLHDIGHLVAPEAPQMDGLGTLQHESIGAQFLKTMGFSAHTTTLVAAHVDAKRYLCAQKPQYFKRLSPASKGTLEWQGGPMSPKECETFRRRPYFEDALRLRSFDEQAKETDYTSPNRELYQRMIERHLSLATSLSKD